MRISIEHAKTLIAMDRGFDERCKIENNIHEKKHTVSFNRSVNVFNCNLTVLQQIDPTNLNGDL